MCFIFHYMVSVIAIFHILYSGFWMFVLYSPHSILQLLFLLYSIFYILSPGCSYWVLQFPFPVFYYHYTLHSIIWFLDYVFLSSSIAICFFYHRICHWDILHCLILQLVLHLLLSFFVSFLTFASAPGNETLLLLTILHP